MAAAALQIIWLAIQIAGLNPKPVTDYIAQLEYRVSALEGNASAKIPHLIAFKGSGEEADLGPFIAWDHAYNAKVGYYFIGATIYFSGANCTGNSYISDENNGGPQLVADGRIVIAKPPFSLVGYESLIYYGDQSGCRNVQTGTVSFWTITDTGERAGIGYIRRVLTAELH